MRKNTTVWYFVLSFHLIGLLASLLILEAAQVSLRNVAISELYSQKDHTAIVPLSRIVNNCFTFLRYMFYVHCFSTTSVFIPVLLNKHKNRHSISIPSR